jgi:hypothetical protein
MDTESLQQAFARALADPDVAVPRGVIATPARFNIHRNNIAAGLKAVLAARYPVIQRLVGEPFFAATARAFTAADPPLSPVLLQYGATFAQFLARFEPAAPYPYLPDIARLEWARHRAYHAADAAPADLGLIGKLSFGQLPALRFTLHPSATIIASPFPVLSIWWTNQLDTEVKPIALDQGGEAALVVRPRLEVITTGLPPGSDRLIAALGTGAALDEAADLAMAAQPAFDLAAALATLFRAEAFAAISLMTT